MGDRYFETRHVNLERLLRWPPTVPGRRPGIGHNGGPPLDMSWSAWIWRRAAAKAWQAPPREVVLRRLRQAAALGLSYRDFSAALLDKGGYLSTALLPLHYAAVVQPRGRDAVELAANPHLAERIDRFRGRLLLLADGVEFGPLTPRRLQGLAGEAEALFGVTADAVLALPIRERHEAASARADRLRRELEARGVPARQCFLLGATGADLELAEAAGLGSFQPLGRWFTGE